MERNDAQQDKEQDWLKLSCGKDFSRILYPNPVCFLYVEKEKKESHQHDKQEGFAASIPVQPEPKGALRNVQVVSWLTATNNEGAFLMSLNRQRYTASILQQNGENHYFTLSIPVHGMEELVQNVGRTSGWYRSKFPSDHTQLTLDQCTSTDIATGLSKSQRKKQSRFPTGIPGLEAVPLGHKDSSNSLHPPLCAIRGTVAHLLCRVTKFLEHPPEGNNGNDGTGTQEYRQRQQHILVMGQVESAFVHRAYWDDKQKQFRPIDSTVAPYLTFFGSASFGYVHATPQGVPKNSTANV